MYIIQGVEEAHTGKGKFHVDFWETFLSQSCYAWDLALAKFVGKFPL